MTTDTAANAVARNDALCFDRAEQELHPVQRSASFTCMLGYPVGESDSSWEVVLCHSKGFSLSSQLAAMESSVFPPKSMYLVREGQSWYVWNLTPKKAKLMLGCQFQRKNNSNDSMKGTILLSSLEPHAYAVICGRGSFDPEDNAAVSTLQITCTKAHKEALYGSKVVN